MEGIKLNGIYLEIKAITEDVRFEVFIAINMKTVARYTSKNCMASHPDGSHIHSHCHKKLNCHVINFVMIL